MLPKEQPMFIGVGCVHRRRLCLACPRAVICLTENELRIRGKRFFVPDQFELFLANYEKQSDPSFKKKLRERMWKMEGIFAEAKTNHGLRRARYRGRSKVQIQVYMISAVQNLKRLAQVATWFIKSLVQVFGKNWKPQNIFETWTLETV